MGLLSRLLGKRGAQRGLLSAAEEVARMPNAAREIGEGGLPIRPRQPFRQAEVGGSGDLAEAASWGRAQQAPDAGNAGAGQSGAREMGNLGKPWAPQSPNESPVRFYFGEDPNMSYSDAANWKSIERRIRNQDWRIENVRLDDLTAGGQDVVDPRFRGVPTEGFDNTPPIIIRHNGRLYIEDGNHRLVAAAERGDKTIRAAVIDAKLPDGDSALPMDEASRFARAREQGFDVDTPLYHGTNQDIDAFNPSDGWYGRGISVSRSPSAAEPYTRRSPSQPRGGTDNAPNMMPLLARGRFAPLEEFQEINGRLTPRLKMTTPEVQEELRRRGYDGVDVGGVEQEILVFDPANLRSRFAKFDPKKRDSSDLLAGLAVGALPAGGLLSYARRRRDEA